MSDISTPKLYLPVLAGQVRENCFYVYIKVPFSARNSFPFILILLDQSTLLLSGIIHQDSDTRVPRPGGWLYLSRDRVWMEDPGIKVTGIRNTQEDGVRTACPPETDTDYPGHDLQSLTSLDLSTCVRMCRTRGTCRGVTWTRDTCQMKFRTVLSRIFKLFQYSNSYDGIVVSICIGRNTIQKSYIWSFLMN